MNYETYDDFGDHGFEFKYRETLTDAISHASRKSDEGKFISAFTIVGQESVGIKLFRVWKIFWVAMNVKNVNMKCRVFWVSEAIENEIF